MTNHVTLDQIKQNVKETLAKHLNREIESILDTDDLFENLGVDSTGIIEILLDLEERCGVEFDVEELDPSHLKTVDSFSSYILQIKH
ncbi:acyl carrier protein [Paenibacillus sp.]|jgi:acyl carrier protein|uniref:acyl carrier protein n=1 Tax=Paenibacillus sp. TaxID=58172 RepID=UPI00282ED7A3|nr:acyl carrier protein [Paenibacillus sp.]MDR0267458.1 acyl carrier protein [Paenibacillus sp.]